jgi:nucleoid-associated protein YgaU
MPKRLIVLIALAATPLLFVGCGKKSETSASVNQVSELATSSVPAQAAAPDQQAAAPDQQAAAPAQAAAHKQVSVPVQVSVPMQGSGKPANPDFDDLNREVKVWILSNRRLPKDFEEFAATANVQLPPPPPGKKYILDARKHVDVVNK